MLFIRCPFCHKLLLRYFYPGHKAKHTAPLPDGQMTNHVTVHPSGRYKGSLTGVPRSYLHLKCGVTTNMPEEIIRSYLVNPFLYGAGSFCLGATTTFRRASCLCETGQNLAEYTKELREAYLRVYGEPPPRPTVRNRVLRALTAARSGAGRWANGWLGNLRRD